MVTDDFINLKNLTKRNYSDYYLQINPFPASAVPDELPPFTADRTREKNHFKDMMGELVNNEKSSVTVFVGEYGSGKSHLMRALKYAINKQLFNYNGGTQAIYVRTPGRNFLDFYIELIEDIQKDNLKAVAERLISEYIEKNRNSIIKLIYDDHLKKQINTIENNISQLLESSMVIDLFKSIVNKRSDNLRNVDVFYALLYCAHPTLSTYAWSWFTGSKLSKDERDLINVRTSIDDPRTAYSILGDLIKLLNTAGIKNMVLFVDELEKLTTISSNLRSIYQDDLRHLIDDHPHEMSIFFSITGFHWQQLLKENTGLVRRIANYTFNLEFFKIDDVKELITKYLEYGRVEGYDKKVGKKIQDCDSAIYPFDEKSVNEIYALTGGVCSKVIKICRKCIDHIVDKNKGEIITLDLVKKLYEP